MDGGLYTVGEVLYLLSLEREDAIGDDVSQPNSVSRFTADGFSAPTATEQDRVMTIARWNDVQDAKSRAGRERLGKLEKLLMAMRVLEFTEREIADWFGVSQWTVHMKWRASLDEILLELGGAAGPPENRTSAVSACLQCALHPRARVAERRKRIRGGWKITRHERQSSLCRLCTPEHLRPQLVGYVPPDAEDQATDAD